MEASQMGARIALVDDEEMLRLMTREMLELLGYRVDDWPEGEVAVAAIAAAQQSDDPFRFALIDVAVVDGWGAVEMIGPLRQADPKLAAIVCSGHAIDSGRWPPGLELYDAWLAKPYTLADLRATLRRAAQVAQQRVGGAS